MFTQLVILLLFSSHLIKCEIIRYVETITSRELYSFRSYKDVQLVTHKIPPETIKASWHYVLSRENDCSDEVVSIYTRYGSFPIINPTNATFPPYFHVDVTYSRVVTIQSTDDGRTEMNVTNPLPGSWFAASLINQYSNKIKQQGLFTSCKVSLDTVLHLDILRDVIPLTVGSPLHQRINSTKYYKFSLQSITDSIFVHITNCSVVTDTSANGECPVVIAYHRLHLPSIKQTSSVVNCSANYVNEICMLNSSNPSVNDGNYIMVETLAKEVDFQIIVETSKCGDSSEANGSSIGKRSVAFKSNERSVDSRSSSFEIINNEGSKCWTEIYAAKKVLSERFNYIFELPPLSDTRWTPLLLNVSSLVPTFVAFSLDPLLDIGGTLTVAIVLFHNDLNKTANNVTLVACLQRGVAPTIINAHTCTSDIMLTANSSSESTDESEDEMKNYASSKLLSLPYPEAGDWYMAMKTFCYKDHDSEPTFVDCMETDSPVWFHLKSEMCVNGGCGKYGSCIPFISGGLIFSSCVCTAGWKGYGCTDGSDAISDKLLLLATLLLTLSNLLFIPAIILAIKRRYFTEAVIYFFTMFFSTFYHACDSDVYTFCLMRGSVMQFCDFYASIMSFWVTIIAIADLPEYLRSLAHMVGALGIALGVEYNRTGLWVFVVPVGTAVIIMTSSWIHHCRTMKACFPDKKRWLMGIIPGILLAGTGIVLFAFFETSDNYAYIHSSWHAATSISILLLLPPKRNYKGNNDVNYIYDVQNCGYVNADRMGNFVVETASTDEE